VKIEKDPNTRKQVMIDWLVERNITCDTTHTKPELYGIIKNNIKPEIRGTN
jgi:hypothetical protein